MIKKVSFALPSMRTSRFSSLSVDAISNDECLIIPFDPEEDRAKLVAWDQIRQTREREFIELTDIQRDTVQISINGAESSVVSLRDQHSLQQIIKGRRILLDISGLPYHVWAPLLKAAYLSKTYTRILYAEPGGYTLHKNPASYSLFDLSKEFEGLAPLPGFAQLIEPAEDTPAIFVALLGFEGNRPRSLIYQLDPPPKVVPVIGVPGFQIEFPTYTITCNQEMLEEFHAFRDMRYTKASCPFDAFDTLLEIRKDYPDHYMYIAPVGTKPHGLGAVLYSIINSSNTEILFDHPVKKKGRTTGLGVIHIYNFGTFDGY